MYGGSIPVMLFEFIYGDITQFQTILVLLQRYSTSFYWTGATGYHIKANTVDCFQEDIYRMQL